MMLVKYNTCLGSIDVQERNLLFKGLFSFSLKIRKEEFYCYFFWSLAKTLSQGN